MLFSADLLSTVSCVSFLLLWALTVGPAPKRDLHDGSKTATLGLLLGGTLMAYLAASLPVFLAGWTLTALPFLSHRAGPGNSHRIAHVLGIALIAAACSMPSGPIAFGAFVAAALLRSGVFPFHELTLTAFQHASPPALSLLLNSHLGAYLLIRFAIPQAPVLASAWLPYLSLLAMFTSIYMAIAALAETSPRRVLGLLWISQTAFIFGGIGNCTEEGITGALVHWWVVSFAMSGMLAVYAAIEARNSETAEAFPGRYLGMGCHAPRLACFFAACGMALVGLPGTLGFMAEDLLFHGGLSAQPLIGVALPLATALNAITVFRLFSTLFLGKRAIHSVPIPDALPRERLALAVTIVILVSGGLMPSPLVALRSPPDWRSYLHPRPCPRHDDSDHLIIGLRKEHSQTHP